MLLLIIIIIFLQLMNEQSLASTMIKRQAMVIIEYHFIIYKE